MTFSKPFFTRDTGRKFHAYLLHRPLELHTQRNIMSLITLRHERHEIALSHGRVAGMPTVLIIAHRHHYSNTCDNACLSLKRDTTFRLRLQEHARTQTHTVRPHV